MSFLIGTGRTDWTIESSTAAYETGYGAWLRIKSKGVLFFNFMESLSNIIFECPSDSQWTRTFWVMPLLCQVSLLQETKKTSESVTLELRLPTQSTNSCVWPRASLPQSLKTLHVAVTFKMHLPCSWQMGIDLVDCSESIIGRSGNSKEVNFKLVGLWVWN